MVNKTFHELFGNEDIEPSTRCTPTRKDLNKFLERELQKLGFNGRYLPPEEWKCKYARHRELLKIRYKSAYGNAKLMARMDLQHYN